MTITIRITKIGFGLIVVDNLLKLINELYYTHTKLHEKNNEIKTKHKLLHIKNTKIIDMICCCHDIYNHKSY